MTTPIGRIVVGALAVNSVAGGRPSQSEKSNSGRLIPLRYTSLRDVFKILCEASRGALNSTVVNVTEQSEPGNGSSYPLWSHPVDSNGTKVDLPHLFEPENYPHGDSSEEAASGESASEAASGGSAPGAAPGGSAPGAASGGSAPGAAPGGSAPGAAPGGSAPGGSAPGGSEVINFDSLIAAVDQMRSQLLAMLEQSSGGSVSGGSEVIYYASLIAAVDQMKSQLLAASGEAASGEAASGEAASGEAASGEAASGEVASGGSVTGCAKDNIECVRQVAAQHAQAVARIIGQASHGLEHSFSSMIFSSENSDSSMVHRPSFNSTASLEMLKQLGLAPSDESEIAESMRIIFDPKAPSAEKPEKLDELGQTLISLINNNPDKEDKINDFARSIFINLRDLEGIFAEKLAHNIIQSRRALQSRTKEETCTALSNRFSGLSKEEEQIILADLVKFIDKHRDDAEIDLFKWIEDRLQESHQQNDTKVYTATNADEQHTSSTDEGSLSEGKGLEIYYLVGAAAILTLSAVAIGARIRYGLQKGQTAPRVAEVEMVPSISEATSVEPALPSYRDVTLGTNQGPTQSTAPHTELTEFHHV